MKLIVGLGNPGTIYRNSRHNIGFSVVRELARENKVSLKKEKGISSLTGKGKIEGEELILSLPLTYMNLSGSAVSGLLKKYRISLNNLLVVCDDLDLEWGRIKIRPGGSSGGHKGLASIIEALATEEFSRLRIGIGRPHRDSDAARYVLKSFTKRQMAEAKGIMERAVSCCVFWLKKGTQVCMNIFNGVGKYKILS